MSEHPDFLRSPKNVFNADPRSTGYAVLGEHGWRQKTLDDHYSAVAQITVHNGVPREIVVKFETAKNLNLFSWFVYRFHTAARSQVYECLEYALRTRFADELLAHEEQKRRARYEQELRSNPQNAKPYKSIDKKTFRPTMHPLLKYSIDIGALKNEQFTAWQLKTKIRARSRKDVEMIEKMKELGLQEIQTDSRDADITDEDRDHDYLGLVLENIPLLRNHYAHGTSSLDDKSLSALRLSSEIINQIFPRPDVAAAVSTPEQRT
jgi:hypothetical protein